MHEAVIGGGGVIEAAAHDQGFVAAAPPAVYAMLVDVEGYREWWPGATSDPRPGGVVLALPGAPQVPAVSERHRPGVGLVVRLGPPLDGTLEWFLERFEEGSIVNAIVNVRLPGRPRRAERRLRRLRAGIHSGLVALKGRLE